MYEDKLPQPYSVFDETVEAIRTGAIVARYLGSGSESEVYEAIVDNRKYAVKFANKLTRNDHQRNTIAATQRKIDAGLRGLGISGLEQIQAASPEAGVAIYDFIDGTTIDRMSEDDMRQVTEPQLLAFRDSIDRAVAIGIEFDPWNQDGSNLLYDPSKGFTLIDYFVDYAKISPEESRLNGIKALGSKAVLFAGLLGEE